MSKLEILFVLVVLTIVGAIAIPFLFPSPATRLFYAESDRAKASAHLRQLNDVLELLKAMSEGPIGAQERVAIAGKLRTAKNLVSAIRDCLNSIRKQTDKLPEEYDDPIVQIAAEGFLQFVGESDASITEAEAQIAACEHKLLQRPTRTK